MYKTFHGNADAKGIGFIQNNSNYGRKNEMESEWVMVLILKFI
jgi:hypothetical protein